MFTIGVFLWLIYGIVTKQASVSLANAITLIFVTLILKYTFYDLQESKEDVLNLVFRI
ncbi:hypothetical protein G9F72_022705 [Clostridium estertheticum]|uniref:hypothetical protein n=1 Tax=Clostridium estertheticum TaxID=238834 RepID=UPI001CD15CA4|nr:hypothetical protein [Clostridium estertheticum]MBZ9689112.1 hypothetical protein [Clostridium estertheticum]